MFWCRLIVVLNALWITSGYKILCLLPYPGKSHMMVFEPMLEELTARGHQLTVVSFFPTQKHIPNRRDVSLEGLAPIGLEVVDINGLNFNWFGLEKYFAHLPSTLAIANSNLQLCETLLSHPLLTEFVEAKGEYDLILVEHFNSDCMLGIVHKYGLPSIGLMSSAMLPWTFERVGAPDNPSYVPGMCVGVTDNMNYLQRIENAFFSAFYLIYFEINIRWKEQQIVERRLGQSLPKLEEIAKNTSLILINTHQVLNGNRILPPSVIEVGGIHLHNRSVKNLPKELDQWVSESKDGFILISFGSLIRGSTFPPEQLSHVLKAIAKLPQRVIWKWEVESGHPTNLPENVKTVRWLPQYELLHHSKAVAFLTHGGLLSMMEAVDAGVPMLVVPILGDQFGNAAHAKAAGVAEVLRLREISESTLYTAFKKILLNGTKARSKKLSEMWKDRHQSPMETAIFNIERLGRHKHLEMSSQARFLSRIHLALIDILAFVIILIIILIVIVNQVYKFLTKRLSTKVKLS